MASGSERLTGRLIREDAPGGSTEAQSTASESSAVSMKSDWSKTPPPEFSPEPAPSDSLSTASESRAVSMKSDRSKTPPPEFSPEPAPSDSLPVWCLQSEFSSSQMRLKQRLTALEAGLTTAVTGSDLSDPEGSDANMQL